MRHDDAKTQLPASFTDSFRLWGRRRSRHKWRLIGRGTFDAMQALRVKVEQEGRYCDFLVAHEAIGPNRRKLRPKGTP